MPSQTKHFRTFFKIVLIAEVIYLGASFFIPILPGWKMFAKFEHQDFKIINSAGKEIDYRPFLPTVNYQLSKPIAVNLAKFICLKSAERPLTLIISDQEKFLLQGQQCDLQKI